jgi:hypothetical protein
VDEPGAQEFLKNGWPFGLRIETAHWLVYCFDTRVAECNMEGNSRVGELGLDQAPDSSRLRALKVTSDAPESRLLLFRKVAVFRCFLGFSQPTCYSLPLPLAGPELSLPSLVNCLFSTQRKRLSSEQAAIGVPGRGKSS